MTNKHSNGGWIKTPDYTPQRGLWRDQMLVILLLLTGVIVAVVSAGRAKVETVKAPLEITSIYWSDADSGRLNGSIKFRLNSVDAPETGGVGAAIGGAPQLCGNSVRRADRVEWPRIGRLFCLYSKLRVLGLPSEKATRLPYLRSVMILAQVSGSGFHLKDTRK